MKRFWSSLIFWLWPTIAFISIIVVILFTFVHPGHPVQGIIILWFVTLCPGMSLVSLLKLEGFIIEITLAIALSLSIDAIVVGLFLYSGRWSPPTMLWVLIVLSLIGPVRTCGLGMYKKVVDVRHR